MNKKLFYKDTFVGFRAAVLIIFAVGLMIFDRYTPSFSFVKGILESTVSPLQYAVHWPITIIEDAATDITSKRVLTDENTALKAEIVLLQAKVQKIMALEQENIKLHGLTSSSFLGAKDKFLIARVLAVNINNFNHKIFLDRGKDDGLYVGQPVLDTYGIMGQVISVGLENSTVLLISDVKSAIPVKIVRNSNRAILIGTGDNSTLELIQVPETFDIKKGDLLVTSDIGSRFPDGYPVGVVTEIERKLGERFLKILVSPSAKINQDRQVLLVWPSEIQLKIKNEKLKNKKT